MRWGGGGWGLSYAASVTRVAQVLKYVEALKGRSCCGKFAVAQIGYAFSYYAKCVTHFACPCVSLSFNYNAVEGVPSQKLHHREGGKFGVMSPGVAWRPCARTEPGISLMSLAGGPQANKHWILEAEPLTFDSSP